MAESKTASVLLTVLVAIAAGAGGAALWSGWASPPPVPVMLNATGRAAEWHAQVGALEERIRQLEAARLVAESAVVTAGREEIGASPAADVGAMAALLERIEQLERQQQRRGAAPAVGERALLSELSVLQSHLGGEPLKRDEARAVILDPNATEAAKCKALGALRNQGADAWTDPVVAEMLRIAQTSPDAVIRADVWRQMDGDAKHPAVVQPMLTALASDTEAKVREEAAETLENYGDQSVVEQALRYAAANDPDHGVRREAARTLEKLAPRQR
ncbi:MAG: HEAT repeat domain-containing protein [Planctomycetota bacterium]